MIADLDGLEKQRTGKIQEWAVDVNRRLKGFAEAQVSWEDDLKLTISKINRNLTSTLGKLEATDPKGFGASLVRAIQIKVSSKAKEQAKLDQSALELSMKLLEDFVKQARGSLKTRVLEFQSLTDSLKEAGPYAEPQRKALAKIGVKLTEQKQSLDELTLAARNALETAKG